MSSLSSISDLDLTLQEGIRARERRLQYSCPFGIESNPSEIPQFLEYQCIWRPVLTAIASEAGPCRGKTVFFRHTKFIVCQRSDNRHRPQPSRWSADASSVSRGDWDREVSTDTDVEGDMVASFSAVVNAMMGDGVSPSSAASQKLRPSKCEPKRDPKSN